MDNELIYLDTYVLQQDMRIRMPKSILENLNLEKGKSRLKIYYDQLNKSLVLKKEEKDRDE
ncbi:MAG: hypothetical protein HFJ03_08570 [Lachnospira sp.]|jgi:hypothetical protein|nr:hypothetical protein [Lachnospira sp.]